MRVREKEGRSLWHNLSEGRLGRKEIEGSLRLVPEVVLSIPSSHTCNHISQPQER